MKNFTDWLSLPYYFNPSNKFKFKVSFFHGLFVFLFLYIFRPFYLNQFEVIILEYTLGIGIIAFLGTLITLYIPPLIFKDFFNEDNWTIGKNLFLMAIGITLIGVILWYFSEMYKEPYHLKKVGLLEFLLYTFLVSLFPLTFFIFINEKELREKRKKKVFEIKEIKRENELNLTKILAKEITIKSDNGKENITFYVDNLVYITSQGNYASFFLQNEAGLKEQILRVTLTTLDKELKNYSNFIRCHKSYIINVNYINDISGNARGYILKSALFTDEIPVSRNFSKQSLHKLIG